MLLAAGANPVICSDDGSGPLHWAARNGHLEIVQTLLGCGADPNALRDSGESALAAAISSGHAGIDRVLIAAGAAVDRRTFSTSRKTGNTSAATTTEHARGDSDCPFAPVDSLGRSRGRTHCDRRVVQTQPKRSAMVARQRSQVPKTWSQVHISSGRVPGRDLARCFGISATAIRMVAKGVTLPDIESPESECQQATEQAPRPGQHPSHKKSSSTRVPTLRERQDQAHPCLSNVLGSLSRGNGSNSYARHIHWPDVVKRRWVPRPDLYP